MQTKVWIFLAVLALAAIANAQAVRSGALKALAPNEDHPNGGGPCVNDTQCGGDQFHGKCLANKTCSCSDDYGGPQCDHKRKSQLTAFLLGFFLSGVGAGRLYLGLILSGVFQLVLGFSTGVLPICGACGSACCDSKAPIKIFQCLSLLAGGATFAWWLADCIIIGTNDILDGDGYRPAHDM